ncbi:MAG: hypothetical protein MK103_02005 [Planctomycetes bacterium]|nr:hypothetical protein [Planctomycetota bacterium]
MPDAKAIISKWPLSRLSQGPGLLLFLGLGIVVLLLVSIQLQSNRNNVELLGGKTLSEAELESARAAFDSKGLKGYRIVNQKLQVPRKESSRYLAALVERRVLPYQYFENALKQRSWLTPEGDFKRQWDLAAQQMIADIIREMDGIKEAWVRWDKAQEGGLHRQEDVRASVIVKTEQHQTLTANMVHLIREVVSGQLSGLAAEKVTVVDLGMSSLPQDAHELPVYQQLQFTQDLEAHYVQKLRALLGFINKALITVNVQLDSKLPHDVNTSNGSSGEYTPLSSHPMSEADLETWSAPNVRSFTDAEEQNLTDIGDSVVSKAVEIVDAPAALDKPGISSRASFTVERISATIAIPYNYFEAAFVNQAQFHRMDAFVQTERARIQRMVDATLPAYKESALVVVETYRLPVNSSATWLESLEPRHVFGLVVVGLVILVGAGRLANGAFSRSRKLRRLGKQRQSKFHQTLPVDTDAALQRRDSRHENASGHAVQESPAKAVTVLENWIKQGRDS